MSVPSVEPAALVGAAPLVEAAVLSEGGPPLRLRPAPDTRPPAIRWVLPERHDVPPDQPPLEILLDGFSAADGIAAIAPERLAEPASGRPDAEAWSRSLARALFEALQGRRPLGQLTRWVDERVLAVVAWERRRRTQSDCRPGRPAVLISVRVQHPHADAAEVSAHLQVGQRSVALAFRLEAWYDRWMCTALELGPAVGE